MLVNAVKPLTRKLMLQFRVISLYKNKKILIDFALNIQIY